MQSSTSIRKQALESVKSKQVASINTKDVPWKRQYLKNSSMKQSHQKKITKKEQKELKKQQKDRRNRKYGH